MKRILVIDDEPNIRFILEVALTDEGYEVYAKESASYGLNLLNEDLVVDLIIVDLFMPGLSGKRFISLLRKDARFSQIPVILLTGSLPGTADFPPKESYQALLEKPFDLPHLIQTVSEQVKPGNFKSLSDAS